MPFQNYAGLRGQTQDPHPYPLLPPNGGLSTCGFIFTLFGMVKDSESGPVNRHSFVRATTSSVSASRFKPKMIRFPPSPRDQPEPLATKSAHLLRLARYPRTRPRFEQNCKRSTCGFVSALFVMVGDRQLNVVDGPVSWRALLLRAQKCRHGEGRRLRGGWGWGGGYVLAPRQRPGALGPGRCQFA